MPGINSNISVEALEFFQGSFYCLRIASRKIRPSASGVEERISAEQIQAGQKADAALRMPGRVQYEKSNSCFLNGFIIAQNYVRLGQPDSLSNHSGKIQHRTRQHGHIIFMDTKPRALIQKVRGMKDVVKMPVSKENRCDPLFANCRLYIRNICARIDQDTVSAFRAKNNIGINVNRSARYGFDCDTGQLKPPPGVDQYGHRAFVHERDPHIGAKDACFCCYARFPQRIAEEIV